MFAVDDRRQRIGRLTPLAAVLARVDDVVTPVPPRRMAPLAAIGRVLAEDVISDGDAPPRPLAWRDGWALRAETTVDAGPYAPVGLTACTRVEAGEALPPGADAVASLDMVRARGGGLEALATVTPGDGVLPAGADATDGETIGRAGDRVGITAAAAWHALGMSTVAVRSPRVSVTHVRGHGAAVLDAIAAWIADAVGRAGGDPVRMQPLADESGLDGVLLAEQADLLILVGGTGDGERDRSVHALARAGHLEAHGIGIRPGETAAFGMVGARPVLLVPGRLDAAFAVWLTLGHRILSRLCGCTEPDPAAAGTLTRKVTSTVGLVEVVPVRREGDGIAPLASGHLPLSVLAHADGWLMVPAESEGFPAGRRVEIRPLP
jgi:molybdopterin biosynthesis enzyme